jgi:hypothetical protein
MRNMRDYGNPEGVSFGGRMGLPTWLTGGDGSATSYLLAYAAGIALIFPAIYFGSGMNRDAPAAAPAEGDAAAAVAAPEPAAVNPMTGEKAPKAVPEIVQKQREAMQRQKEAEEARAQRKAEKREAKKRAGKSASGGASDAGGESTADEQ